MLVARFGDDDPLNSADLCTFVRKNLLK